MNNLTGVIEPHGPIARTMHWGFILVFVYALSKQLDELEELADHELLQFEMVFGAFFLVLLIARFCYMRSTKATALPDTAPIRIKIAAQTVHLGMYLCLAMIPITGLVIGCLYENGVRSGALMAGSLLAHEIFANAALFLIVAHVAAAFDHRRRRDGIWNSMVPFFGEPGE